MLAILRGVRKASPASMARSCFRLFADRSALSSGISSACSIAANTFPCDFSPASIRPEANSPACPDVAHQPALLLLRHEHALAVSGVQVSVLGR